MRRTSFFFLLVASVFLHIQGKTTEYTQSNLYSASDDPISAKDEDCLEEEKAAISRSTKQNEQRMNTSPLEKRSVLERHIQTCPALRDSCCHNQHSRRHRHADITRRERTRIDTRKNARHPLSDFNSRQRRYDRRCLGFDSRRGRDEGKRRRISRVNQQFQDISDNKVSERRTRYTSDKAQRRKKSTSYPREQVQMNSDIRDRTILNERQTRRTSNDQRNNRDSIERRNTNSEVRRNMRVLSDQYKAGDLSERRNTRNLSERRNMRDLSERRNMRDLSERRNKRELSERRNTRVLSEQRNVRDLSEQRSARELSERQNMRDLSERRNMRDLSERRNTRDLSERRNMRDLSERRSAKDLSEQRHTRDLSKRRNMRDLSDRRNMRDSSERRNMRDLSERRNMRDLSERRSAKDLSEQRHTRDLSKRRNMRDLSERRNARDLSKRRNMRNLSEQRSAKDLSERRKTRDLSERRSAREERKSRDSNEWQNTRDVSKRRNRRDVTEHRADVRENNRYARIYADRYINVEPFYKRQTVTLVQIRRKDNRKIRSQNGDETRRRNTIGILMKSENNEYGVYGGIDQSYEKRRSQRDVITRLSERIPMSRRLIHQKGSLTENMDLSTVTRALLIGVAALFGTNIWTKSV